MATYQFGHKWSAITWRVNLRKDNSFFDKSSRGTLWWWWLRRARNRLHAQPSICSQLFFKSFAHDQIPRTKFSRTDPLKLKAPCSIYTTFFGDFLRLSLRVNTMSTLVMPKWILRLQGASSGFRGWSLTQMLFILLCLLPNCRL